MSRRRLRNLPHARQVELCRLYAWLRNVHECERDSDVQVVSVSVFDHWLGFYPEITDGLERAENFWSCLMTLRRILGLWRRSIYSNTSALAASSVGYFVR